MCFAVPATVYSEDQTANADVPAQIRAIDRQIDDLTKARNEEAFQAALIRRQAAAGQGEDPQYSEGTIERMQVHLNRAEQMDQKIQELEQKRADLQAQSLR